MTPYKYSWQAWAEAFAIFALYQEKASIAAEHDIILAGPSWETMAAEHRERLDQLGWFHSEEFNRTARFI